jgi:hypothetical protein
MYPVTARPMRSGWRDRLRVDEVARIWNQASEFVCKIFDETIKNSRRWKEYVYLFLKFKTLTNFYRHVEFINACIRNQKVPGNTDINLIDHRFFYSDPKTKMGNYTCGAARNAVAKMIWKLDGFNKLLSVQECLRAITKHAANPSVVGFLIGTAVLNVVLVATDSPALSEGFSLELLPCRVANAGCDSLIFLFPLD